VSSWGEALHFQLRSAEVLHRDRKHQDYEQHIERRGERGGAAADAHDGTIRKTHEHIDWPQG
jgi:hypothetical protein